MAAAVALGKAAGELAGDEELDTEVLASTECGNCVEIGGAKSCT